ncbi:MAG: transporter substrate-binding domain-containing protein, partial [Deltaproteobacteria bacterium]|nr:transporter substrate-binding domain-containing protein [Candidatus Tharpella sp.]
MKNLLRLLGCFIVLLALVFLFAPRIPRAHHEQILTDAEQAWLAEKGGITFVSQSDYPPFEFLDQDQNRAGMCIELVRWIATEFGFKVNFRNMSFLAAQHAVLSGKADVITSLFYSKEHDEKFDFTSKTWDVPALIFVKTERPDIITFKDLAGKRIAMQRGDYAEEFLQSKGIEYKLLAADSFAQAVDMVATGVADAVIGDQQVVLYHLFDHNLVKQIKSVGVPLYLGQNCMGMRAGATQLQAILNRGIALAREQGIFASINRKWTGTSYQKTACYERYFSAILASLSGLVVLIFGVLFWTLQLRRMVAKKTSSLQRSETYLRTLLETIPDMIWVKDQNGIYISCNNRFERFFGALEPEIVGKTDYDFVDKATADSFRAYDQAAIAAGKACMNEEEVVYADDGHKEFLETFKTPMYAQSGQLIGVLGMARDITTRKEQEIKLEESEEKYRSMSRLFRLMSDNIPDLVWAKDLERKFIFVNKSNCENLLLAQDTDE